jgi:hypothetical protein
MQTYHDGYKNFDPVMLFNLTRDPHEQVNLAPENVDVVNKGLAMLASWHQQQMITSTTNIDPMMTVLQEGGPFHTRGSLSKYVKYLQETGRSHHAERLMKIHFAEL